MFLMFVTKQSLVRFIVILALMPLMVLSMNCGGAGAARLKNEREIAASVVSFVNVDKTGQCGLGQRIKSRIVIDPTRGPELVFANCRNVVPPQKLSVSEIGLLPHDLRHIVYRNVVYDRFDGDPQTGAVPEKSSHTFCRGSQDDVEGRRVVDLILQDGAVHQGTLITARYDERGRYVRTLETKDLKIHPSQIRPKLALSGLPELNCLKH